MANEYEYEVKLTKTTGRITPEELFRLFDAIVIHMKEDYRDIQQKLSEGEFSEITIAFNYPHYTEQQNII